MKLTEYLAIYAAVLSSIVFLWNISRSIPKYKIDIMFGVKGNDADMEHGVYIGVRNPSSQTVHLASFGLLYKYANPGIIEKAKFLVKYRRLPKTVGWVQTSLSNYDIEDECPISLDSGKSHSAFIPNSVLERILDDSVDRKIRGHVQDQLWRDKYSSEFLYPTDGVCK